jgi:uncharacterized protein (TIGR04141 family)
VERDLVRGVTGSPKDASLGLRLFGKDSLRATVKIDLTDLPAQLRLYSARSKAKSYRKHFSWIDYISPAHEEKLIRDLNSSAIELIRSGDSAKCWLAVPDVIDWGQYVRFTYGGYKNRNPLHHDISLDSWITELHESRDKGFTANEVDLSLVESTNVRCFNEDEQEIHRWSLHECLSADVDLKGLILPHDYGHTVKLLPQITSECNCQ